MENTLYIIQLLQSSFDWRNLGWIFALFSGFGVKIAFEVSDSMKKGKGLKKGYWVESVCGIFITFVIGYHSRSVVLGFTGNADLQAGMFALVGVMGYELFKILYRLFTNPKLWERVVDSAVSIFLTKYTKKVNGVNENKEKENEQP